MPINYFQFEPPRGAKLKGFLQRFGRAVRDFFRSLGHEAWLMFLFGIYLIGAGIALALRLWNFAFVWGLFAAGSLLGLLALAIIHIIKERKSNGRHRGASEAHRAGTTGGPGDSTGASGSASGGTGPGVATLPGWYQPPTARLQQIVAQQRAITRAVTQAAQAMQNTPAAGSVASDFSGAFATGKVTGARSFAVDKLGRLTGVIHPAIWTPGENHARCMAPQVQVYYSWEQPEMRSDTHPMESCGHGFYGYYEGSNDYNDYRPGLVSGVIEGYGETIIGTRGFRSMKAKIVALHLPADLPTSVRKLVTRNYPDVPVFDTFEEMVAAYPPDDAGQGLNPDSDPDYGDTNLGVQPGSFRQALMVAIARADESNTELLRAGFPELVYAVQAVRDKPWGLDWLRGIVKADLDHADRGLDMAVL